jgi:hypothetical protein
VGGGPADPGDLIQLVDRSRERGDLLGDLGLERGDVDPIWSMWASIVASRNA